MSRTTELGIAPVNKLLFQYAMPAIIAMTATSLYNIVDSIYIGHGCGALAFGALTVAKPFMDICAAFGSLVGVGASSLLAIYLGQKDYEKANRVLGNVIVMNVILSAIVMAVGLIWLDPILYAFGASADTIGYAHEYMEIILYGNILTHIYFGLNAMLRSAGHPRFSMTATIVAVIVNIILDPLFIFGMEMGVRGAALATVISQGIAVVWQFTKFMNKNELVRFHRGIWRLNKEITFRALAIGMSPFLYNIAHCFVVIIINNQLKHFGGDMAIASYGVINRLTFVFAMMVMGLNQGMQPIAGYNYGAKKYDRMLQSFYLTALYATGVMGIVFFLGECCPEIVTRMFTHDPVLVAQTIKPMRIICSSMLIIGFQMVTGNLFTSIGRAGKAIFLSLTRQVLYLIPLVLWMPTLFMDPIDGVWWAIPASDTLSAITAIIILLLSRRSLHMQMQAE
ncbi:MAG: MATE family efflux transporter [Paludibacteraceae bacterium]|nr:MATE family efflux transporter [Paludibacteraceae bacterium]